MRRFLGFWIVLAPAAWMAVMGASLLFFRHLDLTYGAFAVVVTAPVLQALIMAAATAQPVGDRLERVLRETLREPLVAPVLVLDALVLVCGWLASAQPLIGIASVTSVQPTWLGTKAVIAGALLAAAAVRESRAGRVRSPASPRSAEPWWLLGCGLMLAAAGVQAIHAWIEPTLVAALPPLGRLPTLFRWLVVYSLPFVALNGLILRAGTSLGRRTVPDFWMQATVAGAFVVGLIAVHGFFRLPYLIEPWRSIALTAASLSATSVLLAALLAAAAAEKQVTR